jgi:hypothetical protein
MVDLPVRDVDRTLTFGGISLRIWVKRLVLIPGETSRNESGGKQKGERIKEEKLKLN